MGWRAFAAKMRPRVSPSAYVHPTAVLVGDVEIGPACSIWPHAVLRGDVGPIRLARGVNVQDGAVLHVDAGGLCALDERVTVGHRAVVHGARVGSDTIVGIGAILLEGCRVGAGCIVAAGAVVREKDDIPEGSLAAGVPAKVLRADPALRERARGNAERYVELAQRYRAGELG